MKTAQESDREAKHKHWGSDHGPFKPVPQGLAFPKEKNLHT